MTDDVQLSIRQFSEAWRTICAASSRSAIEHRDGIHHAFSGLPVPFFNVALLTGDGMSGDDVAAYGRRATAWAADKGVPWLFVVTHEGLTPGVDAAMALEPSGLAPLMPLTGMLADRVAPVSRIPDGLLLTVPEDDAACRSILEVNSKAYAMDLEAGGAIIGQRSFWGRHFPVVGLASGAPASCAAVLMVDGCRYVALVATDPDHQRRGYADAAMRRALENAAAVHGELPTVLHATEVGRPVYERMGYRTISAHTVFIEKRFLEGH